jgi:hypothetical protein
MEAQDRIIVFVKAMADAERLRIIGLLTRGPRSLTEITSRLGGHPSEVTRHMEQLLAAGALREAAGLYELDEKAIEALARLQLGGPRESYVPAPDLDEKARRVLAAFLNADGTLKQIPLQPAKLRVVLLYLVAAFAPGTDYTEKEVNTILRRFHLDTAGLRRDLVDAGLLAREGDGSRYWRVEGIRHE